MQSHTEIALSSIQCFTDDGTLDLEELNFLLGLALRDDVVDEEEKRVLNNIFSKVSEEDVKPAVWQRMQQIRAEYGI